EALALGLVDEVVASAGLADAARRRLTELAGKPAAAFASIKQLLRRPMLEEIDRTEAQSVREFVDIWYSPDTRRELEKIKIRPCPRRASNQSRRAVSPRGDAFYGRPTWFGRGRAGSSPRRTSSAHGGRVLQVFDSRSRAGWDSSFATG